MGLGFRAWDLGFRALGFRAVNADPFMLRSAPSGYLSPWQLPRTGRRRSWSEVFSGLGAAKSR